jgi:hypothetical protein
MRRTKRTGSEIPARERGRAKRGEKRGICGAKTRAGGACRGVATVEGRCPMHSTRYSEEERQRWRRFGRLAQQQQKNMDFPACDFSNEQSVRRVLEFAGDAVVRGKLPNSSAQALAKLASVGLRAAELALARRVADIERAVKERGHGGDRKVSRTYGR